LYDSSQLRDPFNSHVYTELEFCDEFKTRSCASFILRPAYGTTKKVWRKTEHETTANTKNIRQLQQLASRFLVRQPAKSCRESDELECVTISVGGLNQSGIPHLVEAAPEQQALKYPSECALCNILRLIDLAAAGHLRAQLPAIVPGLDGRL